MLGVGEAIALPVHGVGCGRSRINRSILAANALIPHVLLSRRSANLQRELELGTSVDCVDDRTANGVCCTVQIDGERAGVVDTANALGQGLFVEMRPACIDRSSA